MASKGNWQKGKRSTIHEIDTSNVIKLSCNPFRARRCCFYNTFTIHTWQRPHPYLAVVTQRYTNTQPNIARVTTLF